MQTTLFRIGEEFQAMQALLAESGGEITPEYEQAMSKWFAELQENEGAKLDCYRARRRQLLSEIAVAKAMEEQYRAERNARERSLEDMDGRLKDYLTLTGQKSVDTPELGRVWIQANGGKLPLVPEGWSEGLDPKTLPAKLQKTALDAEAVRMALEEGEKLPFAALGERGTHVRVR